MVCLARRERMAHKDRLALMVLRAPRVILGHKASKVLLEPMADREHRAIQDPRAIRGFRDRQVMTEPRERKAIKGYPGNRAFKAFRVMLARKVLKVLQELSRICAFPLQSPFWPHWLGQTCPPHYRFG
jgi:hypothetical protein